MGHLEEIFYHEHDTDDNCAEDEIIVPLFQTKE